MRGVVIGRARTGQDDKPELKFSADEVEGDVRMGELSLRGNVVVTYERFRLTSPELSLRRTGRGVEVRGPGDVVFCPCPNPPLTIAFEGGVVGPPADLVLQHPQLRVGGVTMLALPWFWLRAPSRPGILPPNFAWRGGDGLLAGGGVHLPWKDGTDYDELDVTAAGYLKGGVELTARLRTPRSTSRVRWDHLHQDLFSVDAHGSYPQAETGMMAWDLDAVRGPRARQATLNLDEAARAYDRGAAEVMVRPTNGVILGAGVRAVGSRGGWGPSERPAWGPRASLGLGGAIGAVGAWDELLSMATLDDAALGPLNLLRSEGGVEVAARPAFFVTRLGLREGLTVADSADRSGLDAVGSARLEVAAPFVHDFSGDDAPLVHVIEPRLRGALMTARTSGAYWSSTGRPVPLISGDVATASAGFRTAWGRLLGHAGASIEADAGAVGLVEGGTIAESVPVGRYRAAWSSRYLGLGIEGGARLRGDRGQVLVGRTRLGEQDGWHRPGQGGRSRGCTTALRARPGGSERRRALRRMAFQRGVDRSRRDCRPADPQRRRTVRRRRGPDVAHPASGARLARLRASVSVRLGRRLRQQAPGQGRRRRVDLDRSCTQGKRDSAML